MSARYKLLMFGVFCLTACNTTPPARDFSGVWQRLNAFPTETKEIPLVTQHIYRAMTIDVRLKSMLGRWAKEAGVVFRYDHPSDFVIHAPVANIQQPDLGAALEEVNAVFAEHNVRAELLGGVLYVRSTVAVESSATNKTASTYDPPALRPLPPFPTLNLSAPAALESTSEPTQSSSKQQ